MMSGGLLQSSLLSWVCINLVYRMKIRSNNHIEEGLAKNATTMSQIPTYVTGVPNGTEKVSKHPMI
jgi:hypothetical protein